MPTILPISDLRNYTDVLRQVDVDKPVYLTRNGRGSYIISKLDESDTKTTAENLLSQIQQGELSALKSEMVHIAEVAKSLGIKI